MRNLILILIASFVFFDSYSQENVITLELRKIEVKCENNELVNVLNKIVANEQEKYGKLDTLFYDLLVSNSTDDLRRNIESHGSIYITGIEARWPMPSKAFKSILGYIQFGNIIFIVSDVGCFYQGYFSLMDTKRIFSFIEFEEVDFVIDDDRIIRIMCHFLYKDGNIRVFKSSCWDKNGDLNLF